LRFLVTGAAGSIGSALVKRLLQFQDVKVWALDHDEYGLACLGDEVKGDPRLILSLGDVRDKDRIELLLQNGVDMVFHLAAIKRIEAAEYNVQEAIKTNVLGTINLVEACLKNPPEKFLLISSDKAVPTESGISLYGATKYLQEKIVLSANKMNGRTKYSVVRFGNVRETRGNVLEIWRRQHIRGEPLTITDPKMRRFFWHMDECVDFILMCYEKMGGGEIFVPKMVEYNILDLAREMFGEKVRTKIIGVRPGEVLIHNLMTRDERIKAKENEWGWIIKESH